MKRNYLSVFIIALMLFVGCASVQTKDIQVDAQSDPKANFSGYKTYAWLGTAAIVNDPYGQWEPPQFDADAEIMFLIDRELRKRGMSENTADPDLVIAFAAGIDMETLGLKVDSETKMDVLENVPQGGLVVVLMDSQRVSSSGLEWQPRKFRKALTRGRSRPVWTMRLRRCSRNFLNSRISFQGAYEMPIYQLKKTADNSVCRD